MNWLVIPLIMGYVIAGEFTISEKIYRSLGSNMPYYLLYVLCFGLLLGLCYAIHDPNAEGENGGNLLDGDGIAAVAIGLSLAFGFLTLVGTLGYGLAKIPIAWWNHSDYNRVLNRCTFRVAVYEDQILE